MKVDLSMKVVRAGVTDTGTPVPIGTVVEYCGHIPGGMVRVRFDDGKKAIMHPACFKELSEGDRPRNARAAGE